MISTKLALRTNRGLYTALRRAFATTVPEQPTSASSHTPSSETDNSPEETATTAKQELDPYQNLASINLNYSDDKNLGGIGMGTKNADMGIVYTCGKCEERSMKFFTKKAYNEGIVIVECPGCKVKHLVADNLGWCTDGVPKNIEDIVHEKGEELVHGKIEDGALWLT
eukprot:TRINITY_DN78927_c0_g1_i1.p1 TRINITY_DN78927_c0_g1~~TRINITY_DN78927_c0_g1_i1.p1  ORF type:complete len:168 (-),score=9.22 TRINITY_DN78927_c0_g1_i1:130-633(-)